MKPAPSPPASSEKLQKTLADAGFGSRRSLEGWIEAGRVSVNGTRAKLGERVVPSDVIRVDGRRIARPWSEGEKEPPRVRVLRYHKPAGEICTRRDPEGRPCVFEQLPNISRGRWIAVGRLDVTTSGILLFTNAGELANRLMHPANGVEREYAVRVLPWDPSPATESPYSRRKISPSPVKPTVSPALLEQLQTGVRLEDGMARFQRVIDGGGQGQNHWYHVIIREGRTHEVRRIWEAVGFRVSRLIRIRYGPVRLHRELRPGNWEDLTRREVEELASIVGFPLPAAPVSPRGKKHPPRANRPPVGRGRQKPRA
uniref:Ribosomal large subunit pseudouridine synthase B n=1 Tax=Candidatus Kentrum sp. DK TaxID=2126562 RepID=A0A450STV8_9GAMM|nr:MAG: ribosomal large subunit pseudouridine synthase B [Candidatus Kentron sp. DK]VFJ68069.1 MAG: ribosomal large subunit pseudouridine synthase B [Candidatus Kentron sp. DK]